MMSKKSTDTHLGTYSNRAYNASENEKRNRPSNFSDNTTNLNETYAKQESKFVFSLNLK
jgi:hypothetical protein